MVKTLTMNSKNEIKNLESIEKLSNDLQNMNQDFLNNQKSIYNFFVFNQFYFYKIIHDTVNKLEY